MVKRLIYRIAVGFVAAFAVLAFAACSSDDPTGPEEQAPALPSAATMTMELSFFDQALEGQTALGKEARDPTTLVAVPGKTNFMNAALRVYLLHVAFCEAIVPPVSAFALAIHSVPQLQSDGWWLWTYIYVQDTAEYAIFLYGKNAPDRTLWRMEVSTADPEVPLDHFVWFDGEALKFESSGYWQFYEPDVTPPALAAAASVQTPGKPSIRMDWLNLTGNIHRLSVLNNNPDSPDEGDLIAYFASPDMSRIDFTDSAAPDVIYNITWYADGSGSLQVPDYNNGEKACWDTDQFDAACPE